MFYKSCSLVGAKLKKINKMDYNKYLTRIIINWDRLTFKERIRANRKCPFMKFLRKGRLCVNDAATRQVITNAIKKWYFPIGSGFFSVPLCYISFLSSFQKKKFTPAWKLNANYFSLDCVGFQKEKNSLIWSRLSEINDFLGWMCIAIKFFIWSSCEIRSHFLESKYAAFSFFH